MILDPVTVNTNKNGCFMLLVSLKLIYAENTEGIV